MQQLVEFIIIVKSCRGRGTSPAIQRAEPERRVQAVGLLLPALPFSPCRLPAGCSDAPLPLEKRKAFRRKRRSGVALGRKPMSKWSSHQNLCLLKREGWSEMGTGGVQLGVFGDGAGHRRLCGAARCFEDQHPYFRGCGSSLVLAVWAPCRVGRL